MADGWAANKTRRYKPLQTFVGGKAVHAGIAPRRDHSIMVVRCPWGEVVLKPWKPK